jgi:hypothetical protein
VFVHRGDDGTSEAEVEADLAVSLERARRLANAKRAREAASANAQENQDAGASRAKHIFQQNKYAASASISRKRMWGCDQAEIG